MPNTLLPIQTKATGKTSIFVAAVRQYWRAVLVLLAALLSLYALDLYRRERHAFALLSATGVHTFSKSPRSLFAPSSEACSSWPESGLPSPKTACIGFPRHLLSDIQVIVKTGAGERDKTSAILKSYGSCIDNVILVSDAPDRVEGQEVIDVLADLPQSYADNNTDWPAYLAQLEAITAGEPIAKTHEGWKLDRFKFLPMIDRAYQMSPKAKWYVFIEADIYYFWDSLFRELSLLDHDEYHYLGTAAPGANGTYFGYGGAGTVISSALVQDLTKYGTQKLAVKYENMVREDCCGDAVTAYVIRKELGVRIETLYPMFSGEEPEWLGVTKDKWCVPLVGLHRIGPEKMARLWKWERCRTPGESPVTLATLLDFTLTPLLENTPKMGWNNAARIILPNGSLGNESAKACELACAGRKDCLHWMYSTKDKCRISDRVHAGAPTDEEGVVSDWNLEAMALLGYNPAKDPNEYCRKPTWLIPKIM